MNRLGFRVRQAPPPGPDRVKVTLFEVRLNEVDNRTAVIQCREGLGEWQTPIYLRRGDSVLIWADAEKANA